MAPVNIDWTERDEVSAPGMIPKPSREGFGGVEPEPCPECKGLGQRLIEQAQDTRFDRPGFRAIPTSFWDECGFCSGAGWVEKDDVGAFNDWLTKFNALKLPRPRVG